MNYTEFRNLRLDFLKVNKNKDHAIILGANNILLSSPHGVSQVRLGKRKVQESGSLCFALLIQKLTNCNLIAKTKNNYDDANFDPACEYRFSLDKLILKQNTNFVIDFHGIASYREMDINLGTNIGRNIETDLKIFDELVNRLKAENFTLSIDQPFSGDIDTIAGSTKHKHPSLWTIQIEINSAITNNKQNFKKCLNLARIIAEWLENIKK